MAIVADLSGNSPASWRDGRPYDRKQSTVNRNVVGSPIGVTTPQYTGEVVQDTLIAQHWMAGDLTVNGWIAVSKVY